MSLRSTNRLHGYFFGRKISFLSSFLSALISFSLRTRKFNRYCQGMKYDRTIGCSFHWRNGGRHRWRRNSPSNPTDEFPQHRGKQMKQPCRKKKGAPIDRRAKWHLAVAIGQNIRPDFRHVYGGSSRRFDSLGTLASG